MKRETLIKKVEFDQLQKVQSKLSKFKSKVTGGFKHKCRSCKKRR